MARTTYGCKAGSRFRGSFTASPGAWVGRVSALIFYTGSISHRRFKDPSYLPFCVCDFQISGGCGEIILEICQNTPLLNSDVLASVEFKCVTMAPSSLQNFQIRSLAASKSIHAKFSSSLTELIFDTATI